MQAYIIYRVKKRTIKNVFSSCSSSFMTNGEKNAELHIDTVRVKRSLTRLFKEKERISLRLSNERERENREAYCIH